MMKNISPGALRPQEPYDWLPPRLRILRASESRIRELQQLRPSRDQGVLQQRRVQLRTEADSALRQVRVCAAQGDLRQLGPERLAGLINSFAKMARHPISRDMETIVACLGSEVERRAGDGSLAGWSPKHLSQVANGFSKSRGARAGQGLIRLAQALLDIPRQQLTVGQGWTAPSFAMMINGLGKVEGDAIAQALAHLSRAIPEAQYLTPESGWTAQHLAMVIQGLIRSKGEAVQGALTRLALAIRRQDLTVGQGWTAQHLAMAINGLGRGEGPAVDEALAHLARALPPARHLTAASGWSAQHLDMAARGLGKRQGQAVKEALIRVETALASRQSTSPPRGNTPAAGPDERGTGRAPAPVSGPGMPGGRYASASMRSRSTGQEAQEPGDGSMENFRVLRACESRINDLQNTQKSCGADSQDRRNALLRTEVDSALRSARACATGGELRQLTPASLAGMINSFSRMRAWPVIQGIDAIMACMGQEVSRRARQGALAQWSPVPLALAANGLGKCEGAGVREALSCLACGLVAVGQPLRELRWAPRNLAMMINGLGKAEGPWIQAALIHLAQILVHQETWTTESGWSERQLAMVASGLSKVRAQEIGPALSCMARAVRARELAVVQKWGAQSQAIITSVLGEGEGDCVQEALSHLAQAVLCVPQLIPGEGWTAQRLAMMAHGLGKGEGPAVRAALVLCARSVPGARQMTPEYGWTLQWLAMITQGLGRGEGREVQNALDRLAEAVGHYDLTIGQTCTPGLLTMIAAGLARASGVAARYRLACLAQVIDPQPLDPGRGWTCRDLAVMFDALGQTLGCHAVFEKITAQLVHRAHREPEVISDLLVRLSRLALSASHLKSASQLLDALRARDFRPGGAPERDALLWSITLFHCASVQHQPVDQQLTVSFAQAWYHYRHSTAVQERPDPRDAAHSDRWHGRWAADYWQPSATARGSVSVVRTESSAPLSCMHSPVFERLSQQLPGRAVWQEARVNDFPVDILIDGRVCIEVDGPDHFVDWLVASPGTPGRVLVRRRRTRDLFIDHMLRQYGFQVVRIADVQDPAGLNERVRQVVMALDASAPASCSEPG